MNFLQMVELLGLLMVGLKVPKMDEIMVVLRDALMVIQMEFSI